MAVSCEYCRLEGGYGDLLHETTYWLIYLAPSQRYLGTCVVALKRQAADLSELKIREWQEFSMIVKYLEKTLARIFQPDLFNWSCFKNAAFRSDNPKPEVHWHFIPRYRHSRDFSGIIFRDPDFGYIPQPLKHPLSQEVQSNLFQEIKNVLNTMLEEKEDED